MEKAVGFDRQGARRVVEATKYVEGMRKNVLPSGSQAVPAGNPGVLTGRSSGTITKRVGSTPGSGEVICDIYDPAADTLTLGSETVEVKNPYYDEVPDGMVVQFAVGQGAVYWLVGVGCTSQDGSGQNGGGEA